MSMSATARPLGAGLTHEVDVNGRHVIRTDEPVRLGGRDQAPTPHELLPAALAACAATMIAMYASRHGWQLGDVRVEVDYDPDAVPRHFDVRLHLPHGLSAEQARRLRRVAQTCPVRRALDAGCSFDERIVTDGRGADAQVA